MASSTVVARGPPPSVSATAKLVRQTRKITIAAPGSVARSIGRSMLRLMSDALIPSEAASRKRSAGTDCQPCNRNRVASGRLKKTWARITPCGP